MLGLGITEELRQGQKDLLERLDEIIELLGDIAGLLEASLEDD